jgi:hypothetical protein
MPELLLGEKLTGGMGAVKINDDGFVITVNNSSNAGFYVIAANDAPDRWKEVADVVCDGVDDDVEINFARNAIALNSKGGTILMSPGVFNTTSAIIAYRSSILETPTVTFRGCGMHSTYIRPSAGTHAFEVGKSTQMNIIGFGFLLSGSSGGIVQNVSSLASEWPWKMKDNIISEIGWSGDNGAVSGTPHTGWGIDIEIFRTKLDVLFSGALFNNAFGGITYANPANGIKLYCTASPQLGAFFNNGDSIVSRANLTIQGNADGQTCIKVLSPQVAGNDGSIINQIVFQQIVMKDFNNGAFDTACVQMGEVGGDKVTHMAWYGINAEDARTTLACYNVQNSFWDGFYHRARGTGATVFKMDSNTKNFHVRTAVAGVFADTVDVISDFNTDAKNPNVYDDVLVQTVTLGQARINGSTSSAIPDGVVINNSGGLSVGGTRHPIFNVNQGLGGNRTFTGRSVVANQFQSVVQSLTPTGTTQTINFSLGEVIHLDLSSATGNVTLTLNNAVAGVNYTIRVNQGATPRNLIFPVGTLQAGGGGATYVGTANFKDIINLIFDTTNFFIRVNNNFS